MNDVVKLARQLAIEAHDGQVDKQGHEYILHPVAVAHRVRHMGAWYEAAALLHDVLEDSHVEYADLIAAGIPAGVADAVALLSRDPDQSYKEFIESIVASGNPIALEVKFADLSHNLDPRRGAIPESLARRYQKAQAILARVKR